MITMAKPLNPRAPRHYKEQWIQSVPVVEFQLSEDNEELYKAITDPGVALSVFSPRYLGY